mgnify:CR=1 FL=1
MNVVMILITLHNQYSSAENFVISAKIAISVTLISNYSSMNKKVNLLVII